MTHINPPVTVSTLIVRDGKILVGRRKTKDSACGKFDLPGGFLEAGESLEDAARREVKEETGLDLSMLWYFCSRPSKYFDGRDILCVHFLATTDVMPQESDELCEFEWVNYVPDMAAESDAAAMDARFRIRNERLKLLQGRDDEGDS